MAPGLYHRGLYLMHDYRIHTVETAPETSRAALHVLINVMGKIPNLAATMSESPTLINGFVGAFGNFHNGSFNGRQKQTLLLTNAVTNACIWAAAFHSTMALEEGVSAADVSAMREGRLPKDSQLAALSAFARALIEKRGHIDEDDASAFHAAGFGPDQLLEVIAGTAVSVMANYAGNITRPEIEPRWNTEA
jgi:alkylhydroperoxidase family enzyme